MNDESKTDFVNKVEIECTDEAAEKQTPSMWEKPAMEDVSEQVMAQPYIRFT